MKRNKDDWLYGTETRPLEFVADPMESRTDSIHLSEVRLMKNLKKIATFFQKSLDKSTKVWYNINVRTREQGREQATTSERRLACDPERLGA